MPNNDGGGGAERFTDGLNEAALRQVERINEAATQFVNHATRMTIGDDRAFVMSLATLLSDMNNWLPFESAAKQAFALLGQTTRDFRAAFTADCRTLKQALANEWLRRSQRRQQEEVRAAVGDVADRTLPKGMVQRTPEQQLTILIPPTTEQISAIVTRIAELSNAAGIQLLSTGTTLMANTLSSEEIGAALSYRLQVCDTNLVTMLMLNECLFSHELGENVNAIMPPGSIVSAVYELMLKQLPRLAAHTAIPWFNGTEIVSTPGYNRTHGIWYQPVNGGFEFPTTPTREQMEAAVAKVRDMYCGGFKFASEADKANVIGSAIMNVVQPGIDGRSPFVMVTKPEPRTGGTYLATILAMTGQGRMVNPKAWPKNEEERQKSFFSAMRARPSALFFDNISGLFEGDAASLMCSSPGFSGRVLGVSMDESGDIRSCIFGSGNNVEVSVELAERINFINLEAFVDDSERNRYRTGRPETVEEWLEPCHKPAVEALLTMVAWWINNGRPMGRKVLPGFNRACAVVGGILKACGIEGWLGNRSPTEMGRVLDMAEDERLPVIRLIWELMGSELFSPSQLILDWLSIERSIGLPIKTSDDPDVATQAKRIGWWLRKRMGSWWQVEPGIRVRIVKAPDDSTGSRWFLQGENAQMEMDIAT